MPAHDGLWLDDDEHLRPAGPNTSECRPEDSVQRTQPRARTPALEHRYLLPEREDLDCGITPTAEEHSDSGQKSGNEFKHEFYCHIGGTSC